MTSDKSVLEFVVRIAYNISGLSRELKLYFNQFIIYHFSKTLSDSQILNIENRKSSEAFKSTEEIISAAAGISRPDKIWCLAALQHLQLEADRTGDRVVSRKINDRLFELISVLELGNETSSILEERDRIAIETEEFRNRPVVKIQARVWPMTLDYAIRWVLLLFLSTYQALESQWIIVINSIFLPILILILVYSVGSYQRRRNKKLLDNYGGAKNYRIEYQISSSRYTLLAFFLGSGTFIGVLLPEQLSLISFFGLTFYYFFYVRFLRLGEIDENDLIRLIEKGSRKTESLSVDENDEEIVQLETELNSWTGRLEAYVLESALLGALSFSGFLQIMASDLVSFADLEHFAANTFGASQAFINLDLNALSVSLASLGNKVSLFCLVSVESLICSIFFIAVIATRLRFSNIADKVRSAINLAKAYNEKEDSLYGVKDSDGNSAVRLTSLTSKINTELNKAMLTLAEINPVMTYMQYFRNGGILVFLIILVSSSLFITSFLAWTFLALALATLFYFNQSGINRIAKGLYLVFRIEFIKNRFLLLCLATLPIITLFILNVAFQLRLSYSLILVSCLLLSFYFSAWLMFAATIDEQFGEIENTRIANVRDGRWQLVKLSLSVLILFIGLFASLKGFGVRGSNSLIMIAFTCIDVLLFFVGYYLSKIRLLGIVAGAILSILYTGILFKVLHLFGANLMIFFGMVGLLLVLVLTLVWKSVFHSLLARICLISLFIGAVFFSGRGAGLSFMPAWVSVKDRLQIMHEHQTLYIQEIINALEGMNSNVDKTVAMSDWYIEQYGTSLGYTGVYSKFLESFVDMGYASYQSGFSSQRLDSAKLTNALKASKGANKILALFRYQATGFTEGAVNLQLDVLKALGQKESAIQFLEEVLRNEPPDDLRANWKNQIANLRKSGNGSD